MIRAFVLERGWLLSHPCDKKTKTSHGWGTAFVLEWGWLLSHPCDKNKDVAWMGHAAFVLEWGSLLSHPCDKNKDVAWMGHPGQPAFVYNDEGCRSTVPSRNSDRGPDSPPGWHRLSKRRR